MGGTIVACSPGELREIETKMHARKTRMIENGANVMEIPPRATKDPAKVLIGMSGRASYQKNHEAFAKLATDLRGPSVKFLWIGGNHNEVPGDTPDDAVACSGWVTRQRALELTSQLDVYVQTSRWEGMPIALIEAQVAGIPAVVTDVVGNRDVVVHGVTGSSHRMKKRWSATSPSCAMTQSCVHAWAPPRESPPARASRWTPSFTSGCRSTSSARIVIRKNRSRKKSSLTKPLPIPSTNSPDT